MLKNKMLCNACGREIRMENQILREDVCMIKKEWGYFSDKDGEVHSFCLCEKCYDEMIKKFKIPVSVCEKTEMLTDC